MANNVHHRGQFNDGNLEVTEQAVQQNEDLIEAVFYDDFGDMEWDDESVLYEAQQALTQLNQRSNRRGSLERKPKRAEQWR